MSCMKWKVVGEDFPPDDRTVLCIHKDLDPTTPALCYFDEELHGFIPLCNVQSYPIVVTHWMEIPPFQGEK